MLSGWILKRATWICPACSRIAKQQRSCINEGRAATVATVTGMHAVIQSAVAHSMCMQYNKDCSNADRDEQGTYLSHFCVCSCCCLLLGHPSLCLLLLVERNQLFEAHGWGQLIILIIVKINGFHNCKIMPINLYCESRQKSKGTRPASTAWCQFTHQVWTTSS